MPTNLSPGQREIVEDAKLTRKQIRSERAEHAKQLAAIRDIHARDTQQLRIEISRLRVEVAVLRRIAGRGLATGHHPASGPS
jgi:hypothetical protein